MGVLLILGMFNLISFFRGLNIENMPYKFGNGGFWKVIGPLGIFLGLLINKYELDSKIPYIIGVIFNIVIAIMGFILLK